MQVGMNSNIERLGKTLHVQTEDSGRAYGHIITHLFLAGSIIETARIDYEQGITESDLSHLVKTQHQKMLTEINSGAFDKKLMLAKTRPLRSNIPLARGKTQKIRSTPTASQTSAPPMNVQISDPPPTSTKRSIGGPWARPRLRGVSGDTTRALRDPNVDDDDS